ncbi:hypothetical protein P4O66_014704, partial [Electrophorus voltai]
AKSCLGHLAFCNTPLASSLASQGLSEAETLAVMRRVTHTSVREPLAGSVLLPCVYTLPPGPSQQGGTPRVSWSLRRGEAETAVLLAVDGAVRVHRAYAGRVSLPGFSADGLNASLALTQLRTNDSGTFHCQVALGDSYEQDTVVLEVTGAVFHYAVPTERYALSFAEARRACEQNSARVASPEQLWAAFHSGTDSCSAGWLSDQTVRYPVQKPELGCYGHVEYSRGVRNYGKRDPSDLFDVYCFASDMRGEVFPSSAAGTLTLSKAAAHCASLGSQLATVGQLHLAWRSGLDHCVPGWLADGSVRYPVNKPRPECGNGEAGVRTLSSTELGNGTTLFGAYCYRGSSWFSQRSRPELSVPQPSNWTGLVDLDKEAAIAAESLESSAEYVTVHLRAGDASLDWSEQVNSLTDSRQDDLSSGSEVTLESLGGSAKEEDEDDEGLSGRPVVMEASAMPNTALSVRLTVGSSAMPTTAPLASPTTTPSTTLITTPSATLTTTPSTTPTTSAMPTSTPLTTPTTTPSTTPTTTPSTTPTTPLNTPTTPSAIPTSMTSITPTTTPSALPTTTPLTTSTTTPSALPSKTHSPTSTAAPPETPTSTPNSRKSSIQDIMSSLWKPWNYLKVHEEEGHGTTNSPATTVTTVTTDLDASSLTEATSPESGLMSSAASTLSGDPPSDGDKLTVSPRLDVSTVPPSALILTVTEEGPGTATAVATEGWTAVVTEALQQEAMSFDLGREAEVSPGSSVAPPTEAEDENGKGTGAPEGAVKESRRLEAEGSSWAYTDLMEDVPKAPAVAAMAGLPSSPPTSTDGLAAATTRRVEESTAMEGRREIQFKWKNRLQQPGQDNQETTAMAAIPPASPAYEMDGPSHDMPASASPSVAETGRVPPTATDEDQLSSFGSLLLGNSESNHSEAIRSNGSHVLEVQHSGDSRGTLYDRVQRTPCWVKEWKAAQLSSAFRANENSLRHRHQTHASSVLELTVVPVRLSQHSLKRPGWTVVLIIMGKLQEFWKESDGFHQESLGMPTQDQCSDDVADDEGADDRCSCLHGGTCLPDGEGFRCFCPQGYTGESCEIDVDDCMSNPCENGGTCIDKVVSFICLCLPSYSGDMCEKDTEGCEHGWKKFHGHCYRFFPRRHTWEDAEKDCREHSSHLSSVTSPVEQDFLNGESHTYQTLSTLEQRLGHENVWIGLNDRTVEEDFQWTDSVDLVYENWRENQPDNFFAGGEDCVVMISREAGRWNDVPCNYNLAYICKKGTVMCSTPPAVDNAYLVGRRRSHYDIHSVVRYQCADGFFQRHVPTARCRPNGTWERPKIICAKWRMKWLMGQFLHGGPTATVGNTTDPVMSTGDTGDTGLATGGGTRAASHHP